MAYNEKYKLHHVPSKNHYDERGNLKKGETLQGYLHEKYKLRFPEKYLGNPNLIIYRSGWELSFCKWCDLSPSIINWGSEPIRVPYYNRVSKLEECKKLGLNPNNPKNWITKFYNVDFWIQIKKADGLIEKWFVEIKPAHKLKKPEPPKNDAPLKDIRRYNNAVKDYLINESKFLAMKTYAEQKNSKFYIFSEDQLRKFGIIGGRFDHK